ncbi:hypothetical protein CXG50_27530 [Pseudomonas plecoglossicida]|nr:hypothetical protein CSW00_20615 [Pseudomonas sp. MR 02]PLP91039.1 hypothetical protein CX682_12815 [Pseudomonas sp. FFUP_PS_41]PLU96361.1 hypothetical protein CXG52_19710 [Pseudomonas plecoglossicida]PLV01886.1 hypothetical protein CXG50_27530 [Pseudomonas plecoglossicida]TXI08369.1 MAG: hypothetical protein E6Q70_02840 [Pseudomonas monteilii]
MAGAAYARPDGCSGSCRSGLVSRKGRVAAPDSSVNANIAGAALRPFRDTRPLLHGPRQAPGDYRFSLL